MKLGTVLFGFVLCMTVSAAHAGTFEDGMAAFEDANYAKAAQIWQPLAEQGDVAAQLKMGSMYAAGMGVERDGTEALKWFHKAEEQGSVEAEFEIGAMYAEGRGVPVNFEKALKWYRSAAEQGYAPAQYKLGASYVKGEGVSTDYVTAYAWMSIAAKQDYHAADSYTELVAGVLSPEKLDEAKILADELFEKYGREGSEVQ
jgi:TPR repeat protein